MVELSEFMLDKTVTQKRKASNTGDAVEAWANVITDIKMAIYSSGSFAIANFQSPYNNIRLSHNGFCKISAATFKMGDRVYYGSVKYLVLEVRTWGTLYELKMGVI